MIQLTVTRNLIGMNDLLLGVGTAMQVRGPEGTDPVAITKINGANFPYDETYTMKQKMDALQAAIDSLPEVVDVDGNLLTGLIATSNVSLDLAGRIWRKSIDANKAQIWYGTQLMYEYNPTTGNLIVPANTNYIAADAVVTAAFQAADTVLNNAINALSVSLKEGAFVDVGTGANELVQLTAAGKLPAVDGSLLTNLPAASNALPVGAVFAVLGAAPAGTLELNGSDVSRTTYNALWVYLGSPNTGNGSTTFTLPDTRGEFIRGYDNGRGVDAGRTMLSAQSDLIKNHKHPYVKVQSGGGVGGNGGSWVTGYAPGSPETGDNTGGGAETRPRSVAMRYVVKY